MPDKTAEREPTKPSGAQPPMRVLICASDANLGQIWQQHLARIGAVADLVTDPDSAMDCMRACSFDILINDLALGAASAFAIADFAGYRRPDAQVIFVTPATFFSESTIFNTCANACALVRHDTHPSEIAAIAEHHARRAALSPRP